MALPKGAAALLAEKDLEGSLATQEINPTTSGGVENLLSGDPERTLMVIYNLSLNDIYLGFSGDVSNVNGFIIPASGGFLNMNVVDDYEAISNPVFIYSAAAGNQLYIMTTRRETGSTEG